MREIGLICLYGLTAFDDIRTKHVRLIELIGFGLLGLLINFISPALSVKSILVKSFEIIIFVFSLKNLIRSGLFSYLSNIPLII